MFVGALNWGLVGLFDFNLVSFLFGSMTAMENLVYVVVGVAAVWDMKLHMGYCKECGSEMSKKKKK